MEGEGEMMLLRTVLEGFLKKRQFVSKASALFL
jgi:hypothetical protein